MDSAVNTPVNEKKKPFAIASITLILGALLVLWEAMFPVLRWFIAPDAPLTQFVHIPTTAVYMFIILCIFCVAVATFFKKSNIFLIVSLFALAVAYALFTLIDVNAFWDNYKVFTEVSHYPPGFDSEQIKDLFLNYGPYVLAESCMVLGFIVFGLVAIFARMGKVKLTNLWILGTVLFVIAALCALFNAFRAVITNFEWLGWMLEMWLDYGIGDTSNIVVDFFYRLGMPWLFCGTAAMHFISSILLGLYLKKLAK